MLAKEMKESQHGSFKLTQLCQSVVIYEALNGDPLGWGNEEYDQPAFLVYLGCSQNEVKGYLKTLNTFFRIDWCEVRQPKYLSEFEAEIKIRGMQREADTYAFGLDYLLESEEAKHFGCDDDLYEYYTTGVMQRW